MPDPFHTLLSDVQARERRNRAITLFIVATSLVASLLLLYVLTRYYPRWCAYAAIPLAPVALYWIARAGLPSLRVSRIDAAARIDSALRTQNRGATLVELEQTRASAHGPHIDLLTRQLSAIIPYSTSVATVNAYTLGETERRAIKISLVAVLLCAFLLINRPLSTQERLAREIESALASSPDLPAPVRELTTRALEAMRDPASTSTEIRSAIQDARRALETQPTSRPQGAHAPILITAAAQPGDVVTPIAPLSFQGTPTTKPESHADAKQPPASQSQASSSESDRAEKQKKQEQSSSSPSSSSSTQKSQEKGSGQQRGGDGSQDDSTASSSQSENQKDSSEKSGSSGESGEQSQSNDSSNKESPQSSEQQSGGSQGSGSGKGGAGSESSKDSQNEGQASGSGSGKGRGAGKEAGEQGQGSDNASGNAGKAGAPGSGGGQALSDALAKAESSLNEGSDDTADQAQPQKGEKESPGSDKSSKAGSTGNQEQKNESNESTSATKDARAGERGSSQGSGNDGKRAPQGNQGSSSESDTKAPHESSKNENTSSSPKTSGSESSKQGQQSSQKGSPQESDTGEKGEGKKDQQASEKSGARDGSGEKSRTVEGKATPRTYEEGGPDGPPGPGLGGKERYKDVRLGNVQESFDTRYTGADSTEEEGKAPAQPKTTIEDLTLSKPKPAVERGEQRIPLEYRDILR